MAVRCETVLQALRAFAPPHYALEGDVTGLQVGRADKPLERVLCTLDLTLAVAEEARDLGAGLVISHHAVIFRPLKDLRTDGVKGRILETLIKADVAVYVPHTAMDVARDGMNDRLAAMVGLTDPEVLEETGRDEADLLVVPTPEDRHALERKVLERGARSVELHGDRIEVIVPRRRAAAVERTLTKLLNHAPRSIPLRSDATPRGIGRVGRLPSPEPLVELAARLKAVLGAPGVRVSAPDLHATVSKVGVLGGDGRRFVNAAVFAGCDALITGDVDHHTALEARARGLALIDVGHWASERHVAALVAERLRADLAEEPVEVLVSEVDTQPFAIV